jgi:hypothetical protein
MYFVISEVFTVVTEEFRVARGGPKVSEEHIASACNLCRRLVA